MRRSEISIRTSDGSPLLLFRSSSTELTKKWHATTSLALWTILTSLSKFASAPRKTLTQHYESLFSFKYGHRDVEQSSRRERKARKITELEKKDEQTNMLRKQVAERQKQLTELQIKDQITMLSKRVAELEAELTDAKNSTTTAPAPAPARNTAPRAITLQERLGSDRGSSYRQEKAPVGDAELPDIGSGPAEALQCWKKDARPTQDLSSWRALPVPYALSSSIEEDRCQRSSIPFAM